MTHNTLVLFLEYCIEQNDFRQTKAVRYKCSPIIFLNYMQKRYLSLLNLNISETIAVNVAGELFKHRFPLIVKD